MTRRRKFLIFGTICISALCILGIIQARAMLRGIASEYETARVIDEVTKYVDTHDGRWPTSWHDIPDVEHLRDLVRLRFDVDTSELIRDPHALGLAIQPLTGRYRTYLHSQWHLDDLRFALEDGGKPNMSRRGIIH